MSTFASLDEFQSYRQRIASALEDRPQRPVLVIAGGSCGQASGSNDVMRVVKRYILENDLQSKIGLRITGCQGFCETNPFIVVEPGGHLYPKLSMKDVPRVIEATLAGEVVEELLYREPGRNVAFHTRDEIPFFHGQNRLILGTNTALDPIRIKDYIDCDGYSALEKVIADKDPEAVIDEITRSGLRGRGGAGFLTGRKWGFARKAGRPDAQKYLICNADEGDPGAYMDRALLEGNPHRIIEGMLIAGMAIGATQGIIYVRTEYPLAIKHTLIARGQARAMGLLGENILGSGVDFDIEIVRGAGAFVCGEETALIRSIEGYAGEPRQRPPYPVERGLFGDPTCINNVETLANIPVILSMGADAYSQIGVPGNTGTKIFSLVGKIRNTGLVEVPLGTTISTVVYDIGGGSVGEAKIKAIQTGGPSGGCIPTERFDLPIDYDHLAEAGTIMGSGGMIVMDEDTCMVDVARYFMNFLQEESCGKCFTCREGTHQMVQILSGFTRGEGTVEQLDLLVQLAQMVSDTSMCGLGQSASNPVLSTVRYFRDEYLAHIERGCCPAFFCKDLVGYEVDAERCNGCGACAKRCPVDAIAGVKDEVHVIDPDLCTRCGMCFSVCPPTRAAVFRVSGPLVRRETPRAPRRKKARDEEAQP